MITLLQGDCRELLKDIPENALDLVVTSPPYYNARAYIQYATVDEYLTQMHEIFQAVYTKLKNHRYCVVNVGDITAQTGRSKAELRKLPLSAYFITMFEKIGYIFIDDYIWDKGEPESKRNLGNPPYPFYHYPVNCYEHLLIFCKHEMDKSRIPCPDCHETITQSNGLAGIGIQSWECKNPNCPTKSKTGRGKRFSARSVMMNSYKASVNRIPDALLKKWRRDIVKISPVIKINSKGENIIGHTAPFPIEIPEAFIRFYSGVKDTVLDCFMGSGTTGVACLKTNRHFIGKEINETYFMKAKKKKKKLQQSSGEPQDGIEQFVKDIGEG